MAEIQSGKEIITQTPSCPKKGRISGNLKVPCPNDDPKGV
jgi:hypothetical protein